MDAKPHIIFITGVSTTGKTSLFERLLNENRFASTEFHDIDEVGVPPVGLGPWRKYRVEHILFDANKRAEQGVSSIVCGIVFPHEVFESKQYRPELCEASFVALTTDIETIKKRLTERQAELEKAGGYSESFTPENMHETIYLSALNQKVLTNATNSLTNGYILDTSSLDRETVYSKMQDILKRYLKEV